MHSNANWQQEHSYAHWKVKCSTERDLHSNANTKSNVFLFGDRLWYLMEDWNVFTMLNNDEYA
jgi:hypothetical protein